MGVLGLWDILESVGHPVKVEGLEGKVLGVDANIWLYKFIRGFREKDNAANIESHKLGLFNRVSKLLYYRIKPVFVFDGPAPILKRRTLERRQNVRNKTLSKAQDAAMRAMANQLKSQYPNADINNLRIMLPELRSNNLVAAEKLGDEDFNLFYLPPETKKTKEERDIDDGDDDSCSDYEPGGTIQHSADVDVDSKDFNQLPPELRYEILQDIKSKRRRIHNVALPDDAGSFSDLQLERLKARRDIQEKIEKCEKEICANYTGELADGETIQAFRVQSDATSTILYRNNIYDPKALSQHCEHGMTPAEEDKSELETPAPNFGVEASSSMPGIGGKSSSQDESSATSSSSIDYAFLNSLRSDLIKRDQPEEAGEASFELTDEESSHLENLIEAGELKTKQPSHEQVRLSIDSPGQMDSSSSEQSSPKTVQGPANKYTIVNDEDSTVSPPSPISTHQKALGTPGSKSNPISISSVELSPASHQHEESGPREFSTIIIDEESYCESQDESYCQVLPDVSNREQPTLIVEPPAGFSGPEQRSPPASQEATSILSRDEQAKLDKPTIRQSPESTSDSKAPEQSEQQSDHRPISQAAEGPSKTRPLIFESVQITSQDEHVANAQRATKRVTNKIIEDAKELLRLFGIPYMEAAGEAEAQCAKLEELKLTMGTITDDSDIWLFGSQNVYRYFFSDDKYVMQYKMPDIEYHIRMTREDLVCFAMLVGSDYTDGILNVGPVTALEILSEFPGDGLEPLVKFSEWHRGARAEKGPIGDKKRKKLLRYNVPEEFPSRAVYEGYMKPVADSADDKFTWGTPELDELREYARRNFGWDQKKADEKLLPVMKRLNEKIQKTIDTFFFKTQANRNPEMFRSKRVNQALNKIAKRAALEADVVNLSEDDDDDDSS